MGFNSPHKGARLCKQESSLEHNIIILDVIATNLASIKLLRSLKILMLFPCSAFTHVYYILSYYCINLK